VRLLPAMTPRVVRVSPPPPPQRIFRPAHGVLNVIQWVGDGVGVLDPICDVSWDISLHALARHDSDLNRGKVKSAWLDTMKTSLLDRFISPDVLSLTPTEQERIVQCKSARNAGDVTARDAIGTSCCSRSYFKTTFYFKLAIP
jgi:hypothetical protein